jgi:hypothetical protein
MRKLSFHRTPPPIALLTDFGTSDHYVGVMKGVIAGICPEARIIDLSHHVRRQDVTQAAFLLSASYSYFPDDTIFACVVDPGVGTDRDVVCARFQKRLFVAPDNGLLSILESENDMDSLYTVENDEYLLQGQEGSRTTFDGRDVFAPAAAHLADGVDPDDLGPPRGRLKDLSLPHPVKTAAGMLNGQIIHVDQFGNLITNISAATLQATFRTSLQKVKVRIGGQTIDGISRGYADAEEGEVLALISSSGYLEVAVNQGSATDKLGCSRGDEVRTSVRGGR